MGNYQPENGSILIRCMMGNVGLSIFAPIPSLKTKNLDILGLYCSSFDYYFKIYIYILPSHLDSDLQNCPELFAVSIFHLAGFPLDFPFTWLWGFKFSCSMGDYGTCKQTDTQAAFIKSHCLSPQRRPICPPPLHRRNVECTWAGSSMRKNDFR